MFTKSILILKKGVRGRRVWKPKIKKGKKKKGREREERESIIKGEIRK